MRLPGRLCIVRPWCAGDLEPLVRHANDIQVARQLRDRFPHPYSRADGRAFLASVARQQPPSTLAIEVDGEAAGAVGFSVGSDLERYAAEVGYWVARRLWGRGIATEALLLTTEHLFLERNLLRVFAVPFADNAASARVLEKAGFLREGLLRSGCVKYGQPRDQLLFARVNESWKGDVR